MTAPVKIVMIDRIECKPCSKCEGILPLDEFTKRPERRLGYYSSCKKCKSDSQIETRKRRYVNLTDEQREEMNRKVRMNYNKNKEQRRSKQAIVRDNMRNKVFDYLGDSCARCGFVDKRALQIDHINGNGIKERRKMNWYGLRKHILELPQDVALNKYQILCANCNQIKRIENKEN